MSARKHEASLKTQAKDESATSFEHLMKRIEEITTILEKGDRPLDESISLFEEGMRLFKICQQRLDDAERKVSVLLREGGALREQAFPEKEPPPEDEETDEASS